MSDVIGVDRLYNCTEMTLPYENLNLTYLNTSELLRVITNIFQEYYDSELRNQFVDCLFGAQQPPFHLIWWQKAIWIMLFTPMLFVAIAGNFIVIWIVLAHPSMRTITNYFLMNLSVADLLMASVNCLFNFVFMVNAHWPFGYAYCILNNFIANVTVAASVFTLVAISVDRYMAIVRPLKHRVSKKRASLVIVLVWLSSCIFGIPCILYSTTKTKRYANGQARTYCFLKWPDGQYPYSSKEYAYNLAFLGVTYVMPVISMAVCYGHMGHKLWGSRSIGEQTQRQLQSIRAKRKVVRMLIIVVSIFALCWFPYHGYFIYAYHNNSVAVSHYVQHMYLAFYWLAMSNAMVNPVIYYWMNNKFKAYFRKAICGCCGKCSSYSTDSTSLRNTGKQLSQSECLSRSKSGLFRKTRSKE